MKKRKKIYVVITVWALAIVALVFGFVQMFSYADIINNSGVVRGGTQRIAKLELAHTPNDDVIERVDTLLSELQENEKTHLFAGKSTISFIQNLDAVYQKWSEIKDEILVVRAGGNGERLLVLSEEHFKLADDTVYSAQVRAEQEFKTSITIILTLFAMALLFMAFFEYTSNKNIKYVFYTDPLTGHNNNLAFIDKSRELLKNAKSAEYLLLYSNVNNFKFINQSYGHGMGDALIKLMSDSLLKFCGEDELFAHTTADHFVCLLRNRELAPSNILKLFALAIKNETKFNFSEIVSYCCGVYVIKDTSEPVLSMISSATLALTQGKVIHGVAFYDDYLLQKLTRENLLTQHMHEGIEKNEYQVYLQPKVELATGEVVSVEVLCRWNSAEFGFLPPDEFVPLFEKNGFIAYLDFYMMEQACKIFSTQFNSANGDILHFSINFSRITLLQDNFIEHFISIADKYKIPHCILEIEVTESAFITEENVAIRMLEELRSKGFNISMDDFGLGYSSLNLLRKMPIDVLKMDREFLREGTKSDRVCCIIESIVSMAQKLNIQVVCEGVETSEQVALLLQLECKIGQGYFYSKPISVDEFKKKYTSFKI